MYAIPDSRSPAKAGLRRRACQLPDFRYPLCVAPGLSSILLALYFGCGIAMVFGMRLAERYGVGDDDASESLYQHWLGWLIGYETVSSLFGPEDQDDEPTPWIVERIADLLLILFGPAMFVLVGLMVLFRRLMGR